MEASRTAYCLPVETQRSERQFRSPLRRGAPVLLAACAGAVFIFGGVALAGKAPRWTVTDVGTPLHHPGAFMVASAISSRGEVIGQAWEGLPGHQQSRGFVWRNGKMIMLSYGPSNWIDVDAINDQGHIAGDAGLPGGRQTSLLWRNGNTVDLGTLGGETSSPVGINNQDQVAGISQTAKGESHAFIWQNGSMTDLGTFGSASASATAINDRGQVIGTSQTASGAIHAFLWQSGKMTDLGSLSGLDSNPRAINESGDVVGETNTRIGNPVDAVLWKDGKLVNLGRFGAAAAEAQAINDRGHILVALTTAAGDEKTALLLHDGHRSVIGTLGGGPIRTVSLNNHDQIAGYGPTATHARRTFVWQNGRATILPTFDGVDPPWGGPSRLNNSGALVGTSYVTRRGEDFQHVVVWRP
jgi:probable HAF family extracellular repeat protein